MTRQTSFTDLVGCVLPLQLAGMGGLISDVGLAAAVSSAGGLGMLGAGGVPGLQLRSMLDAIAEATDGPYGVNFLMPFIEDEAVEVAARHSRVCDFHFGTPEARFVDIAHEGGALAAWQVGSLEEAVAAVDVGCDFIIVQGFEAGGHVRGTTPLDDLLAATIGTIRVPVVASGGIGTPEKVRDLIDGGAAAVRVGTRFVAAFESPAHQDYVDALIGASASSTEITETFGADWPDAPHRVLRASIAEAKAAADDVVAFVGEGEEALPIQRFSAMPPTNAVRGNIAAMAQYAGTSVEHVHRREPAADVAADLCSLL